MGTTHEGLNYKDFKGLNQEEIKEKIEKIGSERRAEREKEREKLLEERQAKFNEFKKTQEERRKERCQKTTKRRSHQE